MAGRLIRRIVPLVASRLSGEGGQQRPGVPFVAALEDPRCLDADQETAVADGERRDFRDLAPGFRVVLDPFARVCPVFTEIRAPPDGLTMPFTRGGRVDDPARRVVDHVVHGPAFTERAAQLPRLPVVALEEKAAFARP